MNKALLSITKINGGTACNVIDDSVKLEILIRTLKLKQGLFLKKTEKKFPQVLQRLTEQKQS